MASPEIVTSKSALKALATATFTVAILSGRVWNLTPTLAVAGNATADPSECVIALSTDNAAYSWVLAYERLTPDLFGAAMDGVVDDADAFRRMVAFGKKTRQWVYGVEGRTSVIGSSVWFGTDTTSGSIRGAIGMGMEIIGKCRDKPVFDFVGIENGRNTPITTWRFTGDAAAIPSAAMLFGRPRHSCK